MLKHTFTTVQEFGVGLSVSGGEDQKDMRR